MATFKKFEEIHAWQKAREITKNIYLISNRGEFAKDFGLRDQMKRASVSIMANIAEGHGRRTKTEFANFLNIARGSAVDLQIAFIRCFRSCIYFPVGIQRNVLEA